MMPAPNPETGRFTRLVRYIEPDATLLTSEPLKGGISAEVTALRIKRPDGEIMRLIVRQHGPADLASNPQISAQEFRLLQTLHQMGLPVPQPLYLVPGGIIAEPPCIVLEYIEGEPAFAPVDLLAFIQESARYLAQIHHIPITELDYLPRQTAFFTRKITTPPARLNTVLGEATLRARLLELWPWPPINPLCFLHGDYWPGNLLMHEGTIIAIIDWEDAALGDPMSDLANMRLEMLWFFGMEGMHQFTQAYLAYAPDVDLTYLPHWDLCAALRPISKMTQWTEDETLARTMRERHRQFVQQALQALA